MNTTMKQTALLAALLALGFTPTQVSFAGQAKKWEEVKFSHPREITNPYLPLASLKQDILEGKEGGKALRVERTVKPDIHKTFKVGSQNVEVLVVEDREFENGKLSEVTLDYFAQADDGTVYYMGEDVNEYRDGKVVGHSGAWLYGKQTKVPGVLMPGNPKVGDKFRSEDVPKITTEDDEVLSLSEAVTVPAGTYENCLKIKELPSDGGVEYQILRPGRGLHQRASRERRRRPQVPHHEVRRIRRTDASHLSWGGQREASYSTLPTVSTVPPHPRPSPSGRGRTGRQRVSRSGPPGVFERWRGWLPLPEGEGWGEGERRSGRGQCPRQAACAVRRMRCSPAKWHPPVGLVIGLKLN